MIHDRVKASVVVDDQLLMVSSFSVSSSLNSVFPQASVVISNQEYIFANEEIANSGDFPKADITIDIEDTTAYVFHGIVTAASGNETETGITSTLTIQPITYKATMMAGTFDGTANQSYLEDLPALCQDVVQHFNANVFDDFEFTDIVIPPTYTKPLIAPRFINMTLMDILSQILDAYGYSLYVTWEGQIIAGSLVNPIVAWSALNDDMILNSSFTNDVLLSVSSLKLGW